MIITHTTAIHHDLVYVFMPKSIVVAHPTLSHHKTYFYGAPLRLVIATFLNGHFIVLSDMRAKIILNLRAFYNPLLN